jgi:hypothetical protein
LTLLPESLPDLPVSFAVPLLPEPVFAPMSVLLEIACQCTPFGMKAKVARLILGMFGRLQAVFP